jgi:hypothetical protein
MEDSIRKILYKSINCKTNNDIILCGILQDEVIISNYIKNIQMRIGKLWEVIATFHGWLKVKHIDLLNLTTKQAVEIKNADNTDNSSSRHRNYEKLLKFKSAYPDYEVVYACINCNCSTPCDRVLNNGIRYVSGEYALKLLYGEEYHRIIELIQSILVSFLNQELAVTPPTRNTSKLRESPKASTTTSLEKFDEGTRLIAEPNSKKVEDATMGNPQPSS